ncbi:hypothetical protein PAXRUDRAFT_762942 [Paxillus rubicundulus Ve08.2h10]|uniref:Uncharacterized protein n=1 Tax=Paxillus rubicundulus Ve08.2h10 TaxID=930991 RepID=A0A0D0CZV4_9AGAM|nr:hypothetical protein PAXRUDRAFT_762942 [Paxillus rubicundulus Ve08.2h10]
MLFSRLGCHDLMNLLVDVHIWMGAGQHVTKISHSCPIELWVSVGAMIGCLIRVIDIQLSIARIMTLMWKETTHEVMKGTMNVK